MCRFVHVFKSRIAHLRTVFPHLRPAAYTRVRHSVKVYLDQQWRCEVGCHCPVVFWPGSPKAGAGLAQRQRRLAHLVHGPRPGAGAHQARLPGQDGNGGRQRAPGLGAIHQHGACVRGVLRDPAEEDAPLPLQGGLLLRARVPAGALEEPQGRVRFQEDGLKTGEHFPLHLYWDTIFFKSNGQPAG